MLLFLWLRICHHLVAQVVSSHKHQNRKSEALRRQTSRHTHTQLYCAIPMFSFSPHSWFLKPTYPLCWLLHSSCLFRNMTPQMSDLDDLTLSIEGRTVDNHHLREHPYWCPPDSSDTQQTSQISLKKRWQWLNAQAEDFNAILCAGAQDMGDFWSRDEKWLMSHSSFCKNEMVTQSAIGML